MSGRIIFGLALLAMLVSTAAAHADEIRLKDGTKITGTIVGFENDSFRVETAYGYALIRKDKVADINITAAKPESTPESMKQSEAKPETKKELDSKKDPEPKPKSSAAIAPASATAPAAVPAAVKESLSTANVSTEMKSPTSGASPSEATRSVSAAKDAAPPSAKAERPPASATNENKIQESTAGSDCPHGAICDGGIAHEGILPRPSVSTASVEPPVIRDDIRGNTYFNLTYGFQMYKPPSWELIPGARKALPDAVAAMGTYDQTTLLVIGRERTKDSLEAHAAATGKALDGVYENYRLISNKHVLIAGFPAIEQRAHGTADNRDWSVVLLTFLKGDDAYTLLGMTWADSDLIQMQENVVDKTIYSLTFAKQ